jgi:uncharacterized protein (UPF0335 family)
MSDIVERLRDSDQIDVFGLRLEAADEIEHLREGLQLAARDWAIDRKAMLEEIERLQIERDALFADNGDVAFIMAQQGAELEQLRARIIELKNAENDRLEAYRKDDMG